MLICFILLLGLDEVYHMVSLTGVKHNSVFIVWGYGEGGTGGQTN